MSLVTMVTVVCDAILLDGNICGQWVESDSARLVRSEAKRQGWSRPLLSGRFHDYCPRHARGGADCPKCGRSRFMQMGAAAWQQDLVMSCEGCGTQVPYEVAS